MRRAIRPARVNHMNVVLEDFDGAVAHVTGALGGEFLADIPRPEFHACLVHVGRVIFEFFVPHDFLVSARLGAHHVGLEYQADMDEVRAALADHGIGTVRDIGIALHTRPQDCHGVAYEFYDGEFHSRAWETLGGEAIRQARYWRDEHPLGLTGLVGHTHAVYDIAAASAFLQSFLSAEFVGEARRPAIAARASRFQVADGIVELVTPEGDGPLARYMQAQGEGVRSTVFGVQDIDRARRHFADSGIAVIPGTAEGSLAIPPAANHGVMFEFAETP